MFVFIDDSGDAGFKIGKGSSEFFVIALVIFDDNLEIERVATAIKQYRRDLRFPDDAEFKFSKSRQNVREGFLRNISPFNFRVRALVVEKEILYSEELRNKKNSFYSYAIKMALEYNGNSILNARVRIDGSGDRIFRKTFLSYLRRELNTQQRKIVKDCKLVDSSGNVLIQMADMIAGSIHRSYQVNKDDHLIYKKIISSHIQDEWRFQ